MVRFPAIPILAAGAGLPLLAPCLPGQTGIGAGEISRAVVGQGFDDVAYHVFVPQKLKRDRLYPLVFALHGDGASATVHLLELCRISTHEAPVFVVAPGYQTEVRPNAPLIQGAGSAFELILAQVLAGHPVDPGRVVLQGFDRGANLCSSWIDAIQNGTADLKELPFRGVWLSGTAVPPRKPVLGIPFLLFVGEKDTGSGQGANYRESVRTGYRTMFRSGCDVTYLEIPGGGHRVDGECIRLMREHLASFPDHGPALPPASESRLLPVRGELIHGRFGGALDILAQLAGSAGKEKAGVQAAHRRVVDHLRRIAGEMNRRKLPGLPDFLEARRLAASLAQHPGLARPFARLAERLEGAPHLRAEIDAWSAYEKARPSSESDAAAALRALAKGEAKDTTFGRRARAHLQACGEDFPFPFQRDP